VRRHRPWLGALALDAAAVLVFVTGGRDAHDTGSTLGGILGVAAPFLVGLVAGTAATVALKRSPLSWWGGLVSWSSTVVIGLLLRRLAWDRSTALSFVIVTAVALALLFFGWRVLWASIGGRGAVRSPGPPTAAES
jgi:Protein of unknown function (DUF3054)